MTPEDFDRLQALMESRAGYRLSRDRMQLAAHRLGPVARREGFESVTGLLQALWAKPVASQAWAVIEALLTPETWFHRERQAFDVLASELLPALSRARDGRPIRIWTAGCSTGQEAYCIAMAARAAGVPVEILATDLNSHALHKARAGAFSGFEIQRGLSAAVMLQWFDQVEDHWVASPDLRSDIRFERLNLLDPLPEAARFDVVFCRHVLDEMTPARRAGVLDTLERALVDDGCLFLGADEETEGDTIAFRPVAGRKGLYVKAPSTLRRAA